MCFIQEMNPGYGLESDEIHHEADADELQIHSMLQRGWCSASSVIPRVGFSFREASASRGFFRNRLELVEVSGAYSAADTRVILGHKSREIEGLLGYRGRDEVVHADNLVMLEQGG